MDIEPSDDVFCNARSGEYSRLYRYSGNESSIQVSIVISYVQTTLFVWPVVNVSHLQSEPHSVSDRVKNVSCQVN